MYVHVCANISLVWLIAISSLCMRFTVFVLKYILDVFMCTRKPSDFLALCHPFTPRSTANVVL